MSIVIMVNQDQIRSGSDAGMPVAMLKWTETVTYALDGDARGKFRYRGRPADAIKLESSAGDVMKDVTIVVTNDELKLMIKPNTGPWYAKATLYFDGIDGNEPAVGGLDPGVDNGGIPP